MTNANDTNKVLQTQLAWNFAIKRQADFESLQNQLRTRLLKMTQPFKTKLDRKQSRKTLTLILVTWWSQAETLPIKRNAVERKAENLKTCSQNKDSNSDLKNTTAKNWTWISELTHRTNLLNQRRIWFCTWLPNYSLYRSPYKPPVIINCCDGIYADVLLYNPLNTTNPATQLYTRPPRKCRQRGQKTRQKLTDGSSYLGLFKSALEH